MPARYGFGRAGLARAGLPQELSLSHHRSSSCALFPARTALGRVRSARAPRQSCRHRLHLSAHRSVAASMTSDIWRADRRNHTAPPAMANPIRDSDDFPMVTGPRQSPAVHWIRREDQHSARAYPRAPVEAMERAATDRQLPNESAASSRLQTEIRKCEKHSFKQLPPLPSPSHPWCASASEPYTAHS
jgi:hypothetical protein